MEENKTNINCEKPIYRKFLITTEKYSLFYTEIFSCFMLK